ncbi:hypothetical protein OCU04_001242 [Sclerotinia nivalis]|uniref:Uncharacterized protein n=1 Tax=Sclerotinia nivalis TaxID=352851 RepID=A0A9X0AYV5_9HELO|nr:hypothetical protein OCU04_001242 [Sclerotinia nivalis]
MFKKRSVSIHPGDQQHDERCKKTTSQAIAEPTEAILLSTTPQRETADRLSKLGSNVIIVKNHLGEDMKMNLDFGLMRRGPPSADDE